jgi:BirA family biotin operon repressor/biotin-[acetyl-CoA-carboxylase] ligase
MMSHPLFVGNNSIFFSEMDSTQSYAQYLLSKTSPPEGTCVITDYQSAGKGQIGRYWHSAAGKNLLVSYIFYPSFLDAGLIFMLNIVTSLAITDLCVEMGVDARIKWPNDIYVGDRKLAGILIQNTFSGHHLKSSIIGMGINVNESDFPSELPNPVSLQMCTGLKNDVTDMWRQLNFYLEALYLQLKDGDNEKMRSLYHDLLYRRDETSLFKNRDHFVFEGIIREVDITGCIHIQTQKGVESFQFREIKFL